MIKNKITKVFKGVVVSAKMAKTVVVKVDRVKENVKYLKQYIVSKKYKVHDPKSQYKEGDVVSFTPCLPISRDKKWRVIYNEELRTK